MQEEAAAAPEFAAITDYQGADQWGGDQWTSDVAVPPVAPTGADWGAAPGIYCYLLFLEFPHLWYQTSSSMHVVFTCPDSFTLYRVTVLLT